MAMATILILADEEAQAQALSFLLEYAGHTPRAELDAGTALATLDFTRIDLIIADVRGPLRGDEAVRMLRVRGIPTPLLLLSDRFQEETVVRAHAAGGARILSPPHEVEELLVAVEELLSEGGRAV